MVTQESKEWSVSLGVRGETLIYTERRGDLRTQVYHGDDRTFVFSDGLKDWSALRRVSEGESERIKDRLRAYFSRRNAPVTFVPEEGDVVLRSTGPSILGCWLADSVRILGGASFVPQNQVPPSFVCFGSGTYVYSAYVGDSRDGEVEEYEGTWVSEGDTILSSHGQEWSYFTASDRLSHRDGELEISFGRPTPDDWQRALAKQLLTVAGIGKAAAATLAREQIRLQDARRWSLEDMSALAKRTRLREEVLAELRDAARRGVSVG